MVQADRRLQLRVLLRLRHLIPVEWTPTKRRYSREAQTLRSPVGDFRDVGLFAHISILSSPGSAIYPNAIAGSRRKDDRCDQFRKHFSRSQRWRGMHRALGGSAPTSSPQRRKYGYRAGRQHVVGVGYRLRLRLLRFACPWYKKRSGV